MPSGHARTNTHAVEQVNFSPAKMVMPAQSATASVDPVLALLSTR